MNNTTLGLATGVVIGGSVIYAYKNDLKFDDIIEFYDDNKDYFYDLVKSYAEKGFELLQELYNKIMKIVNQIQEKIKYELKGIL